MGNSLIEHLVFCFAIFATASQAQNLEVDSESKLNNLDSNLESNLRF
ncbi:hypothetical protein [uncultured Helicobacter sp.]